jgi:hypothetical protein
MDILRPDSQLLIMLWLFVCLLWTLGGYFLVYRFFNLDPGESLITGFGVGMVSYLFLSNFTARFFEPIVGYTLPGVLIFAAGYLSVYKNIPRTFSKGQLWQWILIIAGISLIAFFFLISRGISLYDEYRNLPIISQMGIGIIPPTYESQGPMGVHYGFQLFCASLMTIGGFFSWSAFDLGKSIVWGYNIIMVVLIAQRYLRVWWKSVLTGIIFVFAGGTRYLLFLLPSSWMNQIDKLIDLRGTSSQMAGPFSTALHMPWTIDGGPPGSYIFGFMNGIYPNYVIAHAGTGTLSITIFFLFWLLVQRERSKWSIAIYTILLSAWALTWESSYGLFGLGIGLTGIYFLICRRDLLKNYFYNSFLPALLSVPIVSFEGGVFTDRLGSLIVSAVQTGGSLGYTSKDFLGFSLRLPIAVLSSHLGNLTLTEPFLILVAVAELGLVVLFLPWISAFLYRRFRGGELIAGIFLSSTWLGFLIPCFIGFTLDRDITRLTAYAIGAWIIVLSIDVLSRKKWSIFQISGGLVLAIMCIGGIENLYRELPAISTPLNSYYVRDLDVEVSSEFWGKLPKTCKIFDPAGFRALIITGCTTDITYRNSYDILPQWQELNADPSPSKLHEAGYDYVYFDLKNWERLTPNTRDQYKTKCVVLLKKIQVAEQARRLFQINNCK